MRIIEDIVRVEKGSKGNLPKSFSVVKKTEAPVRSNKKAPVSKKKAFQRVLKKNIKSKIKRTKKTIKLEDLVSRDGKLILWMLVVLLAYIFFIGIFLYDNKKDVPVSIENTIAELEKEDEIFRKEMEELDKFYSGELLEDTVERIEKMQD